MTEALWAAKRETASRMMRGRISPKSSVVFRAWLIRCSTFSSWRSPQRRRRWGGVSAADLLLPGCCCFPLASLTSCGCPSLPPTALLHPLTLLPRVSCYHRVLSYANRRITSGRGISRCAHRPTALPSAARSGTRKVGIRWKLAEEKIAMAECYPTEEQLRIAETVRAACIAAALAGYEDAGMHGLCHEGAWECAVDAMRALNLRTLLTGPPRE